MFWPLQRRMLDDPERDVPMVYSLTWDGLTPALILTVASGVFEFLCDELIDGRVAKNLWGTTPWPEGSLINQGFSPPTATTAPWGYRDFAVPDQPYVMVPRATPGSSCSAWMVQLDSGNVGQDLRWDRLWAVAGTVKLFFHVLNQFEGDTGADRPQDLALDLVVRPNMNEGGSIEAVLGQRFLDRLALDDPDPESKVVTAINDAYRLLVPATVHGGFETRLGHGAWVTHSPSANGSSLQLRGEQPGVLESHNCGTPSHQLAYLAGLAVFTTLCQ